MFAIKQSIHLYIIIYNIYILGDGDTDVSISLVTADHPQVIEAVAAAAEKARNSLVEITEDMYMEALMAGINTAENRRRKNNPNGAQ